MRVASTLLLCFCYLLLLVDSAHQAQRSKNDADSFVQWAVVNGAKMPNIEVAFDEETNSVGLAASSPINVGELLLSVPPNLVLCGSKATETFGAAIADIVPEPQSPAMQLTLALLVEMKRGESSFWKPYIAMLPEEPLPAHTATEADVETVMGGEKPMLAINGWKNAAGDRWALVAALEENKPQLMKNQSYAPGFSWSKEEALWAASMVRSRQYTGCETWCGPGSMCLTPVAELVRPLGMRSQKLYNNTATLTWWQANHDRSGPNWENLAGNAMGYKARDSLTKGDQVSVKYGEMALETSFSTYGFSAG